VIAPPRPSGRRARRGALVGLTLGALVVAAASQAAAAHAAVGTAVANRDLPCLAGGTGKLLGGGGASVLLFFRPNQAHSRQVLKEMAACVKALSQKGVQFSGIVSDTAARAAVEQDVKAAGIALKVLVDKGNALYGELGVALHPVAVIVGKDHRIAAFQTFSKVNFCLVVEAHIRFLLGEITRAELDRVIAPAPASQRSNAAIARRHYGLALSLFEAQKLDKALDHVTQSLAADATRAPAHTLHGKIHAARGDCAPARKAFEQALKLDANDADAAAGLKRCGKK
jgi:tetratricopeptide (TPR) repeat protein